MWHEPLTRPSTLVRLPRTLAALVRTTVATAAIALTTAVARRVAAVNATPQRGDVPGWVMVTLMTAGLVAVVWILADDWLRQLFQQAVDRVGSP